MKGKLILTVTLFGLLTACFGQQNSTWDKWNWLIGEWSGEGSGQPGQGGGTFSFKPDLDKNILVRKSHSEYPATADKPKVIHDDLMIVYLDFAGSPSKAIYFDNEGHTINYSIDYADGSVVLTSEKIQNVPVFRLIYTLLDKETVNTKFEMSQDGEKFMTYIEGKSKKGKVSVKIPNNSVYLFKVKNSVFSKCPAYENPVYTDRNPLFSTSGISQNYHPIIKNNKSWDQVYAVYGACWTSCARYEFIDGETYINGVAYRNSVGYPFIGTPGPNMTICPPYSISNQPSAFVRMREDTLAKKGIYL